MKTILNTTRCSCKMKFLNLKQKADDNNNNQLDSKELMVAKFNAHSNYFYY